MEINWLAAAVVAVMLYAVLYYWLKSRKILPGIIDFMGPCILFKTRHVGIFDTLSRPKKLLIAYASAGIILTVISGIILTLLFVVSAVLTLISPPEPVAIQNMLLIPGLNEYVPSTIAVWVSLVIALVIHEGGHGIMSRAEGIRVKSTGILTLLIPIGAFVEPDEDDVEKSPLKTKLRMLAAGITNNLVFGIVCLLILAALLGMIVPGDHPYVYGVYSGCPAEDAGVIPGTVLTGINSYPVDTLQDISAVLNGSVPGDTVTITGTYRGVPVTWDVTLAPVPENYTSSLISAPSAGFMGISFQEPKTVKTALDTLTHPSSVSGVLTSVLYFLVLPFSSLAGTAEFGFITADVPDPDVFSAPFPGYWGLIHFLFWSSWINIMLGTFNALPIRAFDGGQMVREVLRSLCRKAGKPETVAFQISGTISLCIITLLVLSIIVPYLFG